MYKTNKINALKKLTQNLTILYVEDDVESRDSTASIFKELFKQVDIAADGREGFELYKKYFLKNNRHYDIAIIDMHMPKMNGLDMSKSMLEINKDQKIIIISAYEDKDHLLEAINIGIQGFIKKPVDVDLMVKVLRKTCLTFHSDDLQYFNALTEASIVSKTDTNGVITYVNDSFCKITGYTRDEMIGHTHSILRHPKNSEFFYKELWDTITSGKIWRGRMVNLSKNGFEFITESTIIPLKDENGNIKEYMAIRNDITDVINLKREIYERNQDKIKQNKVREAQKSFLLLFTHELKTPLNAIINFDKYIKKQLEMPREIDRTKIISLLDSILKNSTNMLEHITKILEISKIDAGKLNYFYSLFNANELVEDVLREYESLLKAKNINVTYNSDKEVFIYSDEHRVKQIFSNILSNAIKYGNDKIVVTLSGNNVTTTLTIEDNGPGIKDKESVFGLFVQEDEHILERKGQGTGIGLYFIDLLCRDLHITYKIKDRDGGTGTCFQLSFDNKTNKYNKE